MTRNANSRFSHLPGVEIQRSKFHRPFSHKTTFDAGKLIPIFCDEVLPGDTFSVDMASLVRMSTPIFPVMDNAYLDTYFFFVPNRLVWDHWKQFNGENTDSYWTQNVEYKVPVINSPSGGDLRGWDTGSIADYFGIPINVPGLAVNALPFRAYCLIWNEWFRDQNTMPPVFIDRGDSDLDGITKYSVTSVDGSVFEATIQNAPFGANPLPVSKYHDYFTSCLPQPQKGPAVTLPLFDDNLPVTTTSETNDLSGVPLSFSFQSGEGMKDGGYYGLYARFNGFNEDGEAVMIDSGDPSSQPYSAIPNNLSVDVSNVAVATISQLRQAFQLQKLYEKDARGGTRYTEILKSHFGVDSPDSRQQRPEYLGGKRVPINIDQVLQTSATDDVTPQGNTAAYSMTSDVSNSFTKSFTEHGYIIGVCCVRTDHTYQQGLERMWSRSGRFDFYWPTLAHISEQAVLVKEIYADGAPSDEEAFGYQEAWADYRYKPSRISGQFRTNSLAGLDSWHYADYYQGGNDDFVLNSEWLCETNDNIARTLAVTDDLDSQFIADFYFKMDCVRPMPLYSVPGLVDHF